MITLKNSQDVVVRYPKRCQRDDVYEEWESDGRGGSIGDHPWVHVAVGDNPDLLKGVFKENLGVDLTAEEANLMSGFLKIANYDGLHLSYYTDGFWSAHVQFDLEKADEIRNATIYASFFPKKPCPMIETLKGLYKESESGIKSKLSKARKRLKYEERVYQSNLDRLKKSLTA
jgi:hypothetical protein